MDVTARTADLDVVRRRRAELRESVRELEAALAAPASGRAVVWGERVRSAVVALVRDFGEHIQVTEGPDGLHRTILDGDLRLANAVEELTVQHGEIAAELAALVAATDPPVIADDVADVRESGTKLIARVARHRQRGADLIYEAYETDIGGGD